MLSLPFRLKIPGLLMKGVFPSLLIATPGPNFVSRVGRWTASPGRTMTVESTILGVVEIHVVGRGH